MSTEMNQLQRTDCIDEANLYVIQKICFLLDLSSQFILECLSLLHNSPSNKQVEATIIVKCFSKVTSNQICRNNVQVSHVFLQK